MANFTIEKKVTDMSIYGITGENQWAGDVIVKSKNGISVHGTYFPTKAQAEAYVERMAKEIV